MLSQDLRLAYEALEGYAQQPEYSQLLATAEHQLSTMTLVEMLGKLIRDVITAGDGDITTGYLDFEGISAKSNAPIGGGIDEEYLMSRMDILHFTHHLGLQLVLRLQVGDPEVGRESRWLSQCVASSLLVSLL